MNFTTNKSLPSLALPLFCCLCSVAIVGWAEETVQKPAKSAGWQSMRDGWEAASFGGDGEIRMETVKDVGGIQGETLLVELDFGDPLTGIRWTGKMPAENFEFAMQARRQSGFDFLGAVTFPIGDQHCSLVLGGWGGGVVGISSIDESDASGNDTTIYKDFENGQWYDIRIRVDATHLVCWIDKEEIIRVARADHDFTIRGEMDPCLPLGIANFQCDSQFRNIRVRHLAPHDSLPKGSESHADSHSETPKASAAEKTEDDS